MVDYIPSLHKGIEAAKIARINIREIKSVFDDLNSQLAIEVKGKLKLEVKAFLEENTITRLTAMAQFAAPKKIQHIVASNPLAKGSSITKLTKWEITHNGYPCRIFLEENVLICEDKKSLEKNLNLLLSDPVVGEKLYKLINLDVQENIEDT